MFFSKLNLLIQFQWEKSLLHHHRLLRRLLPLQLLLPRHHQMLHVSWICLLRQRHHYAKKTNKTYENKSIFIHFFIVAHRYGLVSVLKMMINVHCKGK